MSHANGGDLPVNGWFKDRSGNLRNGGSMKSNSGASECSRASSLEQGRFLLEVDSEYLGMPGVIEIKGKPYVAFRFKDLGVRQVAVLLGSNGGETRAIGELTNKRDPYALNLDLTSIALKYWLRR